MPYIAKIPDEKLPAWLSADRLMLWTLRALRELGGRAHLDALYKRLGQLLRIPGDLLWQKHPPGARQEDYVVRHRMRFALTALGFLELVHTDDQGKWSLSPKGVDFLKPLDEEDAPMAEWDWSRETGIKLTPAEKERQGELTKAKRADHKKRFPKKKSPPPQTSKPAGWPTELPSRKPKPPKPPESDTAD